MTKVFLLLASASGFLAVTFGAFGAHALRGQLSPRLLDTFETAVEYHFFHSLALIAVAIATKVWPGEVLLRWAGVFLSAGIVLFSGSLYALALSGVRQLGMITPIGGLMFLVGWALLFLFALRRV